MEDLSINIITNEADEWFDSEREAQIYLLHLEPDEYVWQYLVYRNGVLDFTSSWGDGWEPESKK